jgi:alpha-amylase
LLSDNATRLFVAIVCVFRLKQLQREILSNTKPNFMKEQLKKILVCMLILSGVMTWTSCASDEDAIKPAEPKTTNVEKVGSSAVMLQTFTLTTVKWTDIQAGASTWASAGFNWVWFPPASRSADTYGYLPTQWYDYNNARGSSSQLSAAINAVKSNGMLAMADVVLNHRNGNATAGADFVNPSFANNAAAVTSSDECHCGTGGSDTGNDFNGGRDLNHNNASVNTLCKSYVSSLANLGFGGARYDMVIGYKASAAGTYKLGSTINVGEYWVDDRNTINNWINASGMQAFDFTTYNRLRTAVAGNYSVLGSIPGLIGINKGRAVTFAGNHDTASSGLLGLVYILTHPGIPCVHINEWNSYSSQIRTLIGLRKGQGIGQTSSIAVQTATTSVYAAIIDGKLAMKIGPGSWSPPAASPAWVLRTSGVNYAIWTK